MSNRAQPSATELRKAGTSTPAALCEAGHRHLQAGRPLDAQICCQQALAIQADHADTLHLMGLLAMHAGQPQHALEWLARAIRREPRPEYLGSLGTTLQRLGRPQEALNAFDKAVQLKPGDANLWRDLGNCLAQLGRFDQALLGYRQALTCDPRHWEAACRSAVLLREAKRLEEAIVHLDLCETLRPNQAFTLSLRATCLSDLKRFDQALADNYRAHALDPTNSDTCSNIGGILQALGRYEEAIAWLDKALAVKPDVALTLHHKAFAVSQLQRFDEAKTLYDRLKILDPDNTEAEWDVALMNLLRGDLEAGWIGREVRWRFAKPSTPYPTFSQPMWLGDVDIAGKTLLVHVDEGLGDSIQFARYVPLLAERGARVIMVDMPALAPLLSKLPGLAEFIPFTGAPLPAFDFHCPITNLPLAFGTRLDTIPSPASYLPRPPAERVEAWEARLGPHDKLRVGLVWSGNPKHKNDRNRSIALSRLVPILDVDATFVSLQKPPREADLATLRARPEIVDHTAELTDYVETAALVSCLDLVVTVDTSVAHLAGALGFPTWVLLPYTPDWRWLLGRDDSPWYASVRLFRQDASRDYAGVVERMREELRARAAAFRPGAA